MYCLNCYLNCHPNCCLSCHQKAAVLPCRAYCLFLLAVASMVSMVRLLARSEPVVARCWCRSVLYQPRLLRRGYKQ